MKKKPGYTDPKEAMSRPRWRCGPGLRPHIVGGVVKLQDAKGQPFKYLWLTDRSKYPGAKVRELTRLNGLGRPPARRLAEAAE